MGYSLYIKCKTKQEQSDIYAHLLDAFDYSNSDNKVLPYCSIDISDYFHNTVGFRITAGTSIYEKLCLICLMKLAKKYNNDLYFDEEKINIPDQKYLTNYKTFFNYSISNINGKIPFSLQIMKLFYYLARGKKFLKEADSIIMKFN